MRVYCWSLLAAFLLTVSLGASPVHADLYWETENITKGVPGQPDGRRIQKNYYTATASRVEIGDGTVMINDYETMTMVHLNTREKTYTERDMRDMGLPPDMPAAEKEKMRKMMAGMVQDTRVVPTNETRTIAGYKCRKYNVSFMRVKGEYWLSKDVQGYEEFRDIGSRVSKKLGQNPMLKQMDIAALMNELEGFPVQTITQVMGGTVTSTLTTIERKRLDPSLFKIPGGYRLVEM